MKTYVLVKVRGPIVLVSHSTTLQWIYSELKKLIPGALYKNQTRNLLDKTISCQFHNLGGKDKQVETWLWKLLCDSGYEPIGTEVQVKRSLSYVTTLFRKEVETSQ